MQVCDRLDVARFHSPIKKYVYLISEYLPNDTFFFLHGFLSSFSISFCSSHFLLISPVSLNLVDLVQEKERTLGFW